jgi:hypothetical protein
MSPEEDAVSGVAIQFVKPAIALDLYPLCLWYA